MIYDGRFVYGQIYSLNDIVEELQMSRTPIRDAIQRLSNDGHFDILPSRGYCLHVITDDELLNRYHYANAIEGYCVYLLAQKRKKGVTEPGVLRLQSLLQQMQVLDFDTVSFGTFSRLDNAFHQEIISSLNSPTFSNMIINHQYGLVNTPELHLTQSPLSNAEILHYHECIFNAIWEGDAPGAYAAVLRHAEANYDNYKTAKCIFQNND